MIILSVSVRVFDYKTIHYVLSFLTAGQYCSVDGLAEPSGDCNSGWFCSTGAFSHRPVEFDNSSVSFSINVSCPTYLTNYTGGSCTPGGWGKTGS